MSLGKGEKARDNWFISFSSSNHYNCALIFSFPKSCFRHPEKMHGFILLLGCKQSSHGWQWKEETGTVAVEQIKINWEWSIICQYTMGMCRKQSWVKL